jgi:hypothetical protein
MLIALAMFDAFISPTPSLRIGLLRSRSTARLLIKRLSILHAASNELRPLRHYGNGIGLFRKESPERRMVPAELMPGAVTMLTDTPSQHPHLINELLTRHPFEVFIHTSSDVVGLPWRAPVLW